MVGGQLDKMILEVFSITLVILWASHPTGCGCECASGDTEDFLINKYFLHFLYSGVSISKLKLKWEKSHSVYITSPSCACTGQALWWHLEMLVALSDKLKGPKGSKCHAVGRWRWHHQSGRSPCLAGRLLSQDSKSISHSHFFQKHLFGGKNAKDVPFLISSPT